MNSNDRRTLPLGLLKVRILEIAYDMESLIETTPLLLTTLLRTLDILSFGEPPMNIQLLLSLLETSLPHDDDPTPTHTFELD